MWLGGVPLIGLANAAPADPVTPYPLDWPHRAPWKLSRELLVPETKRIVFVVDVTSGARPQSEALDHLATLASRYGGRPASWVRLGEDGAPSMRWVQPSGPQRPLKLYVKLREGQSVEDVRITRQQADTIRIEAEVPACPSGPLEPDVSYVFVRYVGYLWSNYGVSETVDSDASCDGRKFPVIRVAQTRIAGDRAPGIGQGFLEARALAHEYGHTLGLASNPAHGQWWSTIPYRGGAHCTHRDCAVHVPTAMALLKGQMLDYCDACRKDIEDAREHWRTGKVFPETERLPQPDPAARVAYLKNYNFRDGGEAEKLLGFGKAVMPALIARMERLPGGSGASAKAVAARVALRIVSDENELRRPPGGAEPSFLTSTSDLSREVLAWWAEESAKFMAGDDWKLPAAIRMPAED